jgi:hypothetical protein
MKEIQPTHMQPGEWYYIESVGQLGKHGSGRQKGLFDKIVDDVAHFSKVTDIERADGTMGYSGMSMRSEPGLRHRRWFRFYQPMEELMMRRAMVRRQVWRHREIDCGAEDFIVEL